MCFPAFMRWFRWKRSDASLSAAFSFSVSSDLFFDAPLPLSILGRASGLRHSADCFPDGLGCSRTRSYSRILPTWVDLGDTPCKRCLCKMFHWTHNAHLSCVWDPQNVQMLYLSESHASPWHAYRKLTRTETKFYRRVWFFFFFRNILINF